MFCTKLGSSGIITAPSEIMLSWWQSSPYMIISDSNLCTVFQKCHPTLHPSMGTFSSKTLCLLHCSFSTQKWMLWNSKFSFMFIINTSLSRYFIIVMMERIFSADFFNSLKSQKKEQNQIGMYGKSPNTSYSTVHCSPYNPKMFWGICQHLMWSEIEYLANKIWYILISLLDFKTNTKTKFFQMGNVIKSFWQTVLNIFLSLTLSDIPIMFQSITYVNYRYCN